MTDITAKPFDWNDNLSKEALEDFEGIRKDLPYCICQNIGMALAKLELLEKQGVQGYRATGRREREGMIDEIFNVMKCFHGSYINQCGELIISVRGNVYFTAKNCDTKEDVICKLLEWCSRPIAKGMPYASMKRNIAWRNSLLCGYNNYLGTNFTLEDMYWIYDKLGNAVNHKLTLKFIHSNFDLSLVRPQKKGAVNHERH